MKVFLIILAVIVFLVAVILSLSAEATIIYDNGWHTSVQILFIKKDVELSKILNFVLFPEKASNLLNSILTWFVVTSVPTVV